ncbi:hypothetical protein AB0H83_08135 [Dactylosporangium sp. NPDC050688]|uniref:hypothetical protein n=1 Tax=Dactylosporangium sp. NPDC050688 TaxID=3157217 RepID=UPI0033ED71D1
MATATVDNEFLAIELTTAEHVLALHGDVRVPRAAITEVELLPDGYAAARGLRAPGLQIPKRRLLATMWTRKGREFVAVRGGEPAVRVTLRDQRWVAVLVSTPQAADLAARLKDPA